MVSQQAFSVGHFSGVDALQHKMVLRLFVEERALEILSQERNLPDDHFSGRYLSHILSI